MQGSERIAAEHARRAGTTRLKQAIEALNREFSEVRERAKDVMRNPFADNDEKIASNLHAMHLTFSRLPFVAGAADRERATLAIIRDVSSSGATEIESICQGEHAAHSCVSIASHHLKP